MMYKWIGSVLIFASCGGFGFSLASSYKKRERMLEQIGQALAVMECELRYRLTPLPELCSMAAMEADGYIRKVLILFSEELDRRISPDAASCMRKIMDQNSVSDKGIQDILLELGRSLGRYDLDGQLKGLDHVKALCKLQLDGARSQKADRIRCYETLGLCAGAALVILLV